MPHAIVRLLVDMRRRQPHRLATVVVGRAESETETPQAEATAATAAERVECMAIKTSRPKWIASDVIKFVHIY